ncbi:hypothetical protein HanHA300_Chr09g0337911 [Helianthus annuus]|nr:hypothetical protein HanHA300_Chr09g0337911 [Helianthus annuus]KAJ0544220.1 hypothetical protein HanHA89_Chr09g0359131 [Helianthus annuus]
MSSLSSDSFPIAGEMEPLRRRWLRTILVTLRTVVVLEILRSQNIPVVLQMLVELVEIPRALWSVNRALWSVGSRINVD